MNRPGCAVLVGNEPRAAISWSSCSPCYAALYPRARHKLRRWSAARRSSIPWRCANSIADDLASPVCCCRSGRRTSAHQRRSCSRCRRWRRFARRSTASSIDTSPGTRPSLPDETIGVGDSFDFQLFDRTKLYSADTRFVLAGIVNRMDRAYVDGASCGEIRLIYRLTRTNAPMTGDQRRLAAAADDAQRRAEGEGRQCRRSATARRSPVPKSRAAGLSPANCR